MMHATKMTPFCQIYQHKIFFSIICKGYYYLVLNSSFKVAKEGDRLIVLNLTVLDWCSTQMIIQLHSKDGGGSTFILRALITCSLNRQITKMKTASRCVAVFAYIPVKKKKRATSLRGNRFFLFVDILEICQRL